MLAWVLEGLAVLALVAVAAALVALHTDWGRAQLRARVLAALDDTFAGEVRVGRLEGSVFGELVLRDVVIEDVDGHEALRAAAVRVRLELAPLLRRRAQVETLAIEGLMISARQREDGTYNLADLIAPREPRAPWTVRIDELSVPAAELRVARRGARAPVRLAGVDLLVSSLRVVRGEVGVAHVTLRQGPRQLTGRDLAVGPGGRVSGTVELAAPIAGEALSATLEARPGTAEGTTAVDLAGTWGEAGAAGVLTIDPAAPRVAAQLEGRLGDGSRATVDLVVSVADGGVVVIERGRVIGRARDLGPVAGVVVAELAVHGRWPLAEGAAGADLALRGHVEGRDLSFGATSAAELRVDVDAAGLPLDPVGSARVRLEGVVQDGRPVGRLLVDARSREPGVIDVVAESRPPDGPWVIDVDATVRVAREVVSVALGRHRFRTRGVDWVGRGGTIEVRADTVVARDLRTSIAGGVLGAWATYHHGGERRGELEAAARLVSVELAEIERSLGLARRGLHLRGVVDGETRVTRRGGRWSGELVGEARRVAWQRGATPIDASLAVRLAPGGVLTLGADVRGPGLGALTASLTVAGPRDPTDVRAWRRLGRPALRHGVLALDGLELGVAARLAGVWPAPVTGRVDGALTLTASGTTGWLRGRELVAPELPAPVDAELTLERSAGRMATVSLDAVMRGVGRARAEATLRVPARPLDLAAWRGLDEEDLHGARLVVDDVILDAGSARLLGLGDVWHGRARVELVVERGLRRVQGQVDVRRLRGGPLARPVDVHAALALDQRGLVVDLGAAVDGRQALVARAEAPWTVGDLRAGRLAGLRDAPLSARARVDALPLATLRRTTGVEAPIGGTLGVRVHAAGTVGAPTGEAELWLAGVTVGEARPTLRELRVALAWDGAELRVDARGAQSHGGRLGLSARLAPGALEEARARLEATRFDLAHLAHLAPDQLLGVGGILDAEIVAEGATRDARVSGVVRVHEAQLPLGGQLGSLRGGTVELRLQDQVLRVAVDGRVGAGTLRARGRGELVGLAPRTFDAAITVADLTLIGALRPRIAGTVEARVRREAGHYRIDATVRDARVAVPEQRGRRLHDPELPADLVWIENGRPPPAVAEPPRRRRLELGVRPVEPLVVAHIRVRPTRVVAEDVRGAVRGAVTVTASAEALAVDGSLEAAGATIDLFDRRYRVERAAVRFDGSIDPWVDVRLVHDFPEVTLIAVLRGRASAPELALSSQPGTYSEGQLLSYLLGGAPGAEPGAETRDAAAGVAATLLSRRVADWVGGYLPVDLDVLRYEAATASDSAAVTIGKWVTRKLFLAYRRRLDAPRVDENANEARLEYWLRRNLLLEATAGDRGVAGVDLIWLRRW